MLRRDLDKLPIRKWYFFAIEQITEMAKHYRETYNENTPAHNQIKSNIDYEIKKWLGILNDKDNIPSEQHAFIAKSLKDAFIFGSYPTYTSGCLEEVIKLYDGDYSDDRKVAKERD